MEGAAYLDMFSSDSTLPNSFYIYLKIYEHNSMVKSLNCGHGHSFVEKKLSNSVLSLYLNKEVFARFISK